MLFAGHNYYPAGGMEDFQGDYDTLVECIEHFFTLEYHEWWNVLDTKTKKVLSIYEIPGYAEFKHSRAAILEWAQKIDNEGNV
jgi:hypothetical protein